MLHGEAVWLMRFFRWLTFLGRPYSSFCSCFFLIFLSKPIRWRCRIRRVAHAHLQLAPSGPQGSLRNGHGAVAPGGVQAHVLKAVKP